MAVSVIPVWSKVPLAQGNGPEDTPDLTIFRPDRPSGAAMVVCPGGGWVQRVAHEKEPVALWLAQHGITAFLLAYRLGPRYYYPAALLDAAESVRQVRARSGEFGVDPKRVGIIGFSAGGHLAANVGVAYDTPELNAVSAHISVSSRPDAMVLVYAPTGLASKYGSAGARARLLGENPAPDLADKVSIERHITAQTPPTFIAHSTLDEKVPVQHALVLGLALADKGVPFEMHLYGRGNHGFGGSPMAPKDPALATWLDHLEQWLRSLGFCAT
jgi:acetyl esterase/lipase